MERWTANVESQAFINCGNLVETWGQTEGTLGGISDATGDEFEVGYEEYRM